MRKLTKQQKGFFWSPDEVELSRDSKDFKGLDPHQQHIFTSNLIRQILLDSKQGSAPSEAFGPIISLPEMRNFVKCWEFFEENIHAESYQHIIENLYPSASEVFDKMDSIDEIIACGKDIDKHYDTLITWNWIRQDTSLSSSYDEYEHKKALWMCLHAVNALEGIRFYVSFACSWAFAELKKMEGNAKIIKLIARDENLHLAFTQQLIKALPKEDPDFAKIALECAEETALLFKEVADQEKAWARYLFQHGSMLGLNVQLLENYVDFIAYKRATSIGVKYSPRVKDNPLPWTMKWIGGAEVQVAPQETQQTQYVIGGVENDITENTFKDFVL
jgi:ribonucleoside-diphosphate reductase beta chain